MSIFSIHSIETAPEASRPLLEGVSGKFGFVPNLLGALAEAPAALEAYLTLGEILAKSSFTALEREVLIIAASAQNDCAYCVAAHSTAAARAKVPEQVIAALREGRPIADPRLEALRRFTEILVEKRGWAGEDEVQAFIAAGFSRRHALEVVLGVAFKTLSNYTNHIVGTPLDEAFAPRAWAQAQAATG